MAFSFGVTRPFQKLNLKAKNEKGQKGADFEPRRMAFCIDFIQKTSNQKIFQIAILKWSCAPCLELLHSAVVKVPLFRIYAVISYIFETKKMLDFEICAKF